MLKYGFHQNCILKTIFNYHKSDIENLTSKKTSTRFNTDGGKKRKKRIYSAAAAVLTGAFFS